jgi:hypothetical protein
MSFHQNESLERLVKNSNELYKVVIWYGEMIQKSNPIYRNTESLSFIKAPFYASSKKLFRNSNVFVLGNIIVIRFFTLFFYLLLYFDLGKRLMSKFTREEKKSPNTNIEALY